MSKTSKEPKTPHDEEYLPGGIKPAPMTKPLREAIARADLVSDVETVVRPHRFCYAGRLNEGFHVLNPYRD